MNISNSEVNREWGPAKIISFGLFLMTVIFCFGYASDLYDARDRWMDGMPKYKSWLTSETYFVTMKSGAVITPEKTKEGKFTQTGAYWKMVEIIDGWPDFWSGADFDKSFIRNVEAFEREAGLDIHAKEILATRWWTHYNSYVETYMGKYNLYCADKNYEHRNLLFYVAAKGCTSCMDYLVNQRGMDINAIDCYGFTIAHYAAYASKTHRYMIQWILEHPKFNKELINLYEVENKQTLYDIALRESFSLDLPGAKGFEQNRKRLIEILRSAGSLSSKEVGLYEGCMADKDLDLLVPDDVMDERIDGAIEQAKKARGYTEEERAGNAAAIEGLRDLANKETQQPQHQKHYSCIYSAMIFSIVCENYGQHCSKLRDVFDRLKQRGVSKSYISNMAVEIESELELK